MTVQRWVSERVAEVGWLDGRDQLRFRLGDASRLRGARGFARELCQMAGHDRDVTTLVEICVSELCTNALLHGANPAALTLIPDRTQVRVEVFDSNPDPPALREHPTEAGGRGLRIIGTLASTWGYHAAPGGKVIWAVIDCSARRTS